MFRTLMESRPQRTRSRSAAFASLVIHVALAGTAVAATRLDPPADIIADDFPPLPPIHTQLPTEPTPTTTREAGPASDVFTTPSSDVMVPPLEIPDGLPPVDAGPVLSTEELLRHFERRRPAGDPAGPGTGPVTGDPFALEQVERAVEPLGPQRPPRYPEVLRAARVEGDVVVRFVVDTLGRVEPASFSLMGQAHPLFEQSVRTTLLATRYRAAEWRGRRVRQLVEQRFVFTLTR